MPNRDGTGPDGRGARTGGQRGTCPDTTTGPQTPGGGRFGGGGGRRPRRGGGRGTGQGRI